MVPAAGNATLPAMHLRLLACGLLAAALPAAAVDTLTWTSPSRDSLDSMPLPGRHGAGANVWVQDGSVWIYLAHNGAYDEQARLLKLGCLRLTPVGTTLGGAGFRQTLATDTGTITIQQGEGFSARLWFADQTLVVTTTTAEREALDVAFATWRDQPKKDLLLDFLGKHAMRADRIDADGDGLRWWHRNLESDVDVPARAAAQGIPADAVHDVTTMRVSGGALEVDGGLSVPVAAPVAWQAWQGTAWTGRTAPRTHQTLAVRLGGAVDGDPQAWQREARALLEPQALAAARQDEDRRWASFWDRSHLEINPTAGEDDPGFRIGRNYRLFRFMLACNRDGELPLLFNGGIFTVDNHPGRITGNNNDELPITKAGTSTPDFRRWMFCSFMSQNQRWLGWPTLANGDADLLAPTLRYYRERAATAAARARRQGAEGVVYPEPMDVWGLCCVAPRTDGLCGAKHLTYHFSMMLEHAWMALQAHDALGIPLDADLPWIAGTVRFFDSFYRAQERQRSGRDLDAEGHLVITPGNALEFGQGTVNAIDAVAGLTRVTGGLLALPDLPADLRGQLERLQAALPPLPTGTRHGRPALLPARSVEREYNRWEPVEMYAAWPYRMVGITRPETLALARDTWASTPDHRYRLCGQDYSWMANVANMAALGLPEEARTRALWKMANSAAPQARFPAFFGPGHDWLPDHNWGGSGMTGVQEMLLAPEPGPRGKLHLFPAWPLDWDVRFKLHAPGSTVVEGELQGGRLVRLEVTPASRAADIVDWRGRLPPLVPLPKPLSQGRPTTVAQGGPAAAATDGDLATAWKATEPGGWVQVDLGSVQPVGSVRVVEPPEGVITLLAVDARHRGTWQEVARSAKRAPEVDIAFPPVQAEAIRVRILEAAKPATVSEVQVFPPAP